MTPKQLLVLLCCAVAFIAVIIAAAVPAAHPRLVLLAAGALAVGLGIEAAA